MQHSQVSLCWDCTGGGASGWPPECLVMLCHLGAPHAVLLQPWTSPHISGEQQAPPAVLLPESAASVSPMDKPALEMLGIIPPPFSSAEEIHKTVNHYTFSLSYCKFHILVYCSGFKLFISSWGPVIISSKMAWMKFCFHFLAKSPVSEMWLFEVS